ncbi:SAM domain (Sterile alpha motif) [Phytophthora infestans]|uniref:SAM domain (Sterile alpha motif) n=1 Tax=Phytophthora infestans TaxID=4787 RepID=A0A8S9ULJ3_PHYIN|nr:SAM domain (Sterile alpha motif) [Phytophthora infestans]
MSNQLEDDLHRVLRLARAEARAHKQRKNTKVAYKPQRQVEQRHRHDRYLTGSKERQTLLSAKMQGLEAVYGLDSSSRHLGDCGSKSVLYHRNKETSEDDQMLQQRLDARRTLYKRHFSGVLAESSGRKREKEHVLEAAAREARSSRANGVGIGAAVLTESQTIYSAGAVENGALVLCAEHAAVMKMLTSSATSSPVIAALAICSEQRELLPFPCGSCRELLADCGDFPVYLVNALGETEETRSSVLFPRARHSEFTQILTKSVSKQPPVRTPLAPDQAPLEVKQWTTDDVLKWLEQDVGLPQYRDVFERNNVDGCTLVLLEGSDLQLLLGITHPLHRSKLLTHLDRLRDRELLARGLDYTQLADYLAVLDIDRVSAIAQLKTTFDRLDADHDGFLDFTQVKQALSRLRCSIPAANQDDSVEATPLAVERLLHSEELFGKEAASAGKVSFAAFTRAFSKLATQPADTSTVTQGAFAVHAFGPRLPVLDLKNLRQCFEHQAHGNSLDEAGLVRLLQELGQSDTQSSELACRWLDAQEDNDNSGDAMDFAQFIARYARLVDSHETSGVSRLQQLFTSYEPVRSSRLKPRTVVQRALSTLFPAVSSDEVGVWCASFWPSHANGDSSNKKKMATLTFPEFTLACLEFAAEMYAREQEAASIKRSLRNDALAHRSRVVHLHSSGHVRMCPQPPEDDDKKDTKERKSHEDDGKFADREAKAQDSDDEKSPRRSKREQQVDEAFDRFVRRRRAQIGSSSDDGKQDSEDEEEGCMLNAVEAAQAALELGAALSREQVLRYLEREGLGRIRRRDISRTAFHRLMKRLDANQSFPRDLLLDIKDTEASRKSRTASKSPRHRVYKSRPDYDEFLRRKVAESNGSQWKKEVEQLRRKQQHREARQTSKKTRKHERSRHRKHDSKEDSDRDSTASERSTRSRRHRSRSRHKRRSRRHRSSSSGTSTETDTSSNESTRSPHRQFRRSFQPGARVASMVHGRGTIERIYRDYFVADVHFDSGRHLRNVEFSGLHLLDVEDELQREISQGFNMGTRVTIAHKGTKTRRQGKIILCRTDGTFDVLVDEFGLAQTLKRLPRSALTRENPMPTVYRDGDRVMVRQRTEYLRGKICKCRAEGTYDVKLVRSPQKILERLAPELLVPDNDEDGYSDEEIEVGNKAPTSKPKQDSDDEFEPEFSRGDRVEARFGGGKGSYYPGTIERVHPNGCCDISYDDGDEEERVKPSFIRALPKKNDPRKPTPTKKPASDDGYESDLFESD